MNDRAPRAVGSRVSAGDTFAVIDIGTSSVRVNIAQLDSDGHANQLDRLQQPVGLGKDTFTKGFIEQATIEDAVNALKGFDEVLQEYGVVEPRQIHAVATSAVRDAANRDAFVDRVYMATGIVVDVIDAAEQTRLTYQSVLPDLESAAWLRKSDCVVVEVGGGSTELLLMRGRDVLFSHHYRLGSLRLREMLEKHRVTDAQLRRLMEGHVDLTIEQMRQHVALEESPNLVVLGGEARLAAELAVGDWKHKSVVRVPVAKLSRVVDEVLGLTVDQIVARYQLVYREAETLGPTLVAYLRLARVCKRKHIVVSTATMRRGLLVDMATGGTWSEEFFNQIVRSAQDLGRKYEINEAHAQHVAHLSRKLFEVLQDEHKLTPRHGMLLYVAALVHEIGLFVSLESHHKHSRYLIMNSEIFGVGQRDLRIIALVARYHRRAVPKPSHDGYAALDRDDRILVSKLAAILRVADALDRSHSQRARKIKCTLTPGQLEIAVPGVRDVSLELLGLREKADMFQQVYGRTVTLQSSRAAR